MSYGYRLATATSKTARWESFTEALSQNATVTAVDLSRNSITSAGAQVAAQHALVRQVSSVMITAI